MHSSPLPTLRRFVDVGAQGGYAQRAFNELAKQVTAALIQDGFLPKKAKLTGYLEERGCYKVGRDGARMHWAATPHCSWRQ